MPASKDPIYDREIFLKILMMDTEGLWARKNKPMKMDVIVENLTYKELKKYFEAPAGLFTGCIEDQEKLFRQAVKQNIALLAPKKGLSREEKEEMTRLAFNRLSYDDRLEYCLRPEETQLENEAVWEEINDHLGTHARSLAELIRELGMKKFCHVPTVGDCFAGGGSVPFEAARMGLKVYASELNPLGGLLTWAGLNILSLPNDEIRKLKDFQEKVFDAVAGQVEEWSIEKNERGWMAKYYLYCNETTCPHCKTKVPMAPSWWVSKRTNTVALLRYNKTKHKFDIDIVQGATKEQIEACEKASTVRDGSLWCPKCKEATSVTVLRRDDIDEDGDSVYGLRKWGEKEFLPRLEDVFQERLYAIKYLEKNDRKTWAQFLKKPAPATDATYGTVYYVAPDENDLQREQKVVNLLTERFDEWQTKGYIPASKIEPGDKTNEPIRTRGWQYWHQLFNPRQLLMCGLFADELDKLSENIYQKVFGVVSLNRTFYYASKICLWDNESGKGQQTFYNQALNTLYNTIMPVEV